MKSDATDQSQQLLLSKKEKPRFTDKFLMIMYPALAKLPLRTDFSISYYTTSLPLTFAHPMSLRVL